MVGNGVLSCFCLVFGLLLFVWFWRGLSLLLTWFLSGRKMPISTSVPLSPNSKRDTCSTPPLCERERGGGGGEREREEEGESERQREKERAGRGMRAREKENERAEARTRGRGRRE